MLDSFYHMRLNCSEITFGVKTLRFCHYVCNIVMNVII